MTQGKKYKREMFSANLQAARTSLIERTKQLFILSYLGIGLLIAFSDELSANWVDIFWWAAEFSFVANVFILLQISELNADYFEKKLTNKKKEKEKKKKLERFGSCALFLLISGTIFSVVFISLKIYT